MTLDKAKKVTDLYTHSVNVRYHNTQSYNETRVQQWEGIVQSVRGNPIREIIFTRHKAANIVIS